MATRPRAKLKNSKSARTGDAENV